MPRGHQAESCRNLEDEPQRELQATRGISGIIGQTEKWGGYDAHEILVVDMIQNVESIGGQFELLRVVVATLQAEGFPEAQVNIGIAWPMTRIPSDARRTVIVRSAPLGAQVIIISRQGKYSAGIVHRTRQNVLRVETKILAGVQAQRKGHAVAP